MGGFPQLPPTPPLLLGKTLRITFTIKSTMSLRVLLLQSLSHLLGYENKISRREIYSIDLTLCHDEEVSWGIIYDSAYQNCWNTRHFLVLFSQEKYWNLILMFGRDNDWYKTLHQGVHFSIHLFLVKSWFILVKHYIWGYISHFPCSWLNHGFSWPFLF